MLGSIVGTSWRPAKTRIFLSPTRSNAAVGAWSARTASTARPRPAIRIRAIFMAASTFGTSRARLRGRITYAPYGLAPPRLRRRDRIARHRRLDPRHRWRGQPVPRPPEHATALSRGHHRLAHGSDGS